MNSVAVPFVLCFLFCGVGAAASLAVRERRIPAFLAWSGSLAAAAAAWASAMVLCGSVFHAQLWTIRMIGTLRISLDRLSAIFLLIASVVVLASSIFSASYLKRYEGHYKLRIFAVWYLLLFASVVWILIAEDVLGFLIAWEVMSIVSYLLVNFEHQREEASRAAYLMLAMGEAGFLGIEVVLLFLAVKTNSLEFPALKTAALGFGTGVRWMVFLLSFFGFGVKAGLAPVNNWLPRAHPAAPANVSAILSGVILNLGLYGIIRVNLDLIPIGRVGPGLVVLITGTISAIVGILYATTESDLKALLAHSSIENIGIVTVALGVGMIFEARGYTVLAGMAFIAAFYHMVNHSLYKALLFLGAGAVDDRACTRDLDKMGGLIRGMPATAALFLVGALAISALPPLNGFVSEWLTLQTLLRSAQLSSTVLRLIFALSGAVLALTAALAVTCFVKAFAMAFLGLPRSQGAAAAAEAGPSAISPMVLLAVLCLFLGIGPTYVIPVLTHELKPLITQDAADALVPRFFASNRAVQKLPPAFVADFHALGAQVGRGVLPGRGLVVLHRGGEKNPVVFAMSPSYAVLALGILLLVTWFLATRTNRNPRTIRAELWAGGIPRLLPEMTYTATGFSNPVRVVFQAIFRPNIVEDTRETVAVHFRTAIRRRRDETYLIDRVFFHPVGDTISWIAEVLAGMHHGRLNMYVAYTLGFLLGILILFRLA